MARPKGTYVYRYYGDKPPTLEKIVGESANYWYFENGEKANKGACTSVPFQKGTSQERTAKANAVEASKKYRTSAKKKAMHPRRE